MQARRKRKELGQEPPRGYVLSDAFRLWCNLKRGRITSYMDEKRRGLLCQQKFRRVRQGHNG